MGRINYDEVDKYGNNSDTEFLKLTNDGDMITAQLMVKDMEDVDIYACHQAVVGKWDDGKEAMTFSKDYAKDLAFGLCMNGYPAIVMIKPDYLTLINHINNTDTE